MSDSIEVKFELATVEKLSKALWVTRFLPALTGEVEVWQETTITDLIVDVDSKIRDATYPERGAGQ